MTGERHDAVGVILQTLLVEIVKVTSGVEMGRSPWEAVGGWLLFVLR